MTRLLQPLRILRYAALSGFQDFGSTWTPWTWAGGLFLRMMAQVAFFASIGRLLGSDAQVEYLFIGNAVVAAAVGCLTAATATSWERGAGTLPLLVACPTSPLLVLMGRSVFFIANGMAFSLGALLLLAPVFDVTIPWRRFPAVFALVGLTAVTTYFAATFLGGLVLNATSARRTVPQVARMVMMAFCGVSVPRSVFPEPVRRLAGLLPLTHGLDAIRGVLDGAAAATVAADVGLELLVGAGWLALSLLTFRRLADAGRRDGSIVFSSA
jgi:ABC-2 type transport system permease protein